MRRRRIVLFVCCLILLIASFRRAHLQPACSDPTPQVLTDGYCLQGYWIPGALSDATYWHLPPTNFRTRALYENPGVAEATAALSGFDTSRVEGLVSLLSPSTAGWIFRIRVIPQDGIATPSRWVLVMDVSAARQPDMWFHGEDENSGLELSYPLAVALGDIDYVNALGDRYLTVQVCLTEADPDAVCAAPPVDYRRWLEKLVTWETAASSAP